MIKVMLSIFVVSAVLTLSVLGVQLYQGVNMSQEAFALSQDVQRLKLQKELAEVKQRTQQDAIRYRLTTAKLESQEQLAKSGMVAASREVGAATLYLWPVFVVAGAAMGAGLYAYSRRQGVLQEVEKSRNALLIQEESAALKLLEKAAPAIARSVAAAIPKQSAIVEPPVIDVVESVALPAFAGNFSAGSLLNDPELQAGFLPLGRNAETGQIAQAEPEFMTCVDIVGKQNHCKTTILKMLTLGLFRLQDAGKDLELYLFDPHAGLKDSLESFLRPALGRFKSTVLGENAIEQGQHLELMGKLEQELVRRQETGNTTPFIVLIIDELHDILDLDSGKEFYQKLKKIRRLRKAGIMQLIIWHDSTKEGTGQGTGLMGLNVSAFVVNSTKSKAAKVLESGDSEKAVNLERGKAVVKLPGDESEIVQLPYVQESDLLPFLQNIPAQDAPTGADEPETGNDDQGITPEAVRGYLRDNDLSQNALAKQAGISSKNMSYFLNGKRDLKPKEMESLLAMLRPENRNVVDLAKYRSA